MLQHTTEELAALKSDIARFIEGMRLQDQQQPLVTTPSDEAKQSYTPQPKKSSKKRDAGDQRSGFKFFGK